MHSPKSYYKFSGEYFFQFFALGALLPFLSIYLESIGLNGTQIGTIMALGSSLMIFSPPLWGIISDKTHKHKYINLSLMGLCLVLMFVITKINTFGALLIPFALYYFFSTPLNPLVDGITLHHKTLPFGKVRLWGSVGFAIAALATGQFVKIYDIKVIFPIYIIAMLIAMVFLSTIKIDLSEHAALNLADVKKLLSNKVYLVLLLYIFLVAGTLGAHNYFFGLLYQELGGPESGIGIAFFLFAVSEAPFMQAVPYFAKRFGVINLLIFAPIIGVFRWILHAAIPDPNWQIAIFILQGIFYAPFLIGVAEYIRTRVPAHLRSSAMTIYAAVGFGLGGIFTNFVSGLIYDYLSAPMIYAFYAVICFFSIGIVVWLKRLDHKAGGRIL